MLHYTCYNLQNISLNSSRWSHNLCDCSFSFYPLKSRLKNALSNWWYTLIYTHARLISICRTRQTIITWLIGCPMVQHCCFCFSIRWKLLVQLQVNRPNQHRFLVEWRRYLNSYIVFIIECAPKTIELKFLWCSLSLYLNQNWVA